MDLVKFSSPIGESIFSTHGGMCIKINLHFSSPIGESIFSTSCKAVREAIRYEFLVPYRGIYFLYGIKKRR